MTDPVPVGRLFETHLTVSDLEGSVRFYREVVGLPIALEVPERCAAFFWVGGPGHTMLGLWSLGSAPVGLVLHIAFDVAIDDLFDAPTRLRAQGIRPLSFFGEETSEPSVICWMPAAALYFRDPDGHLLEYLTMLDDEPRPELGFFPGRSGWRSARHREALPEDLRHSRWRTRGEQVHTVIALAARLRYRIRRAPITPASSVFVIGFGGSDTTARARHPSRGSPPPPRGRETGRLREAG